MHAFQNSAKGLGLLVDMNWDRLLFIAAIAIALIAASNIGYLTLPAGF
ncbi:MAG: hypothetical protein AAF576_08515 [Pseudomonadota bacterium]